MLTLYIYVCIKWIQFIFYNLTKKDKRLRFDFVLYQIAIRICSYTDDMR